MNWFSTADACFDPVFVTLVRTSNQLFPSPALLLARSMCSTPSTPTCHVKAGVGVAAIVGTVVAVGWGVDVGVGEGEGEGGTAVAVGGAGVLVGGAAGVTVGVGGLCVGVGGTGVFVGGITVAVGVGGAGVGTSACATCVVTPTGVATSCVDDLFAFKDNVTCCPCWGTLKTTMPRSA